jgi:hypothetical protein
MEKRVTKQNLHDRSEIRENLAYWLSRPPEERIAAVEMLRKQYYGTIPRLQRTVEIIQLKPR